MRVTDRFLATGIFEGERVLTLRSIPPGARVREARLALLPLTEGKEVGPDVQTIDFPNGDGILKSTGSGQNTRWVEIAFPGPRTAIRVAGTDLGGATLQVDFGGAFVEINANGAVRGGPGDPAFELSESPADLPRLRSSRIRIARSGAAAPQPDVTSLDLLVTGSNLAVSLGGGPPVWARPGDLTAPATTTDLAESFTAALADAEVEGGFALLPITIHSDTPARLAVVVEMEVKETAAALGDGFPEAKLTFAHGGTAEAEGDRLFSLRIPEGRRVLAEGTGAVIEGGFDESEIVLGDLVSRDLSPGAAIPAGHALAQPFLLDAALDLDSVDLPLATEEAQARLEIDLRGDLDGKPGSESVLAAAATLSITAARSRVPRWTNAALSAAHKLDPGRYWLTAQSLAGTARWSARAAQSANGPVLQASRNGGLSWRAAAVDGIAGTPETLFRLRRRTEAFQVPVEIEIGRGEGAERLSLAEMAPLGRIDFALDGAALASSANRVLSRLRAGACPRGEQLANGDFADRPREGFYVPVGWTASGGEVRVSPPFLAIGFTDPDFPPVPESLSQTVPAASDCPYELSIRGVALREDPRLELIWRTEDCGVARVDTLLPPRAAAGLGMRAATLTTAFIAGKGEVVLPERSLRVQSPADAAQVELRMLAPAESRLVFDRVALVASPIASRNPSLLEFEQNGKDVRLAGWTPAPEEARIGVERDLQPDIEEGLLVLRHPGRLTEPLSLTQVIPARGGDGVVASFRGNATASPDGEAPSLAVAWRDAAGESLGAPLEAVIDPDASDIVQIRGTAPDGAATAALRLVLPPGSALRVEHAAFDQPAVSEVPVAFLSQAPGELTVRDFTIAFEPVPPTPLSVPETGLCRPTPADQLPGDVCEADPCAKARPTIEARRDLARRAEVRRPVGSVAARLLQSPLELRRLANTPRRRRPVIEAVPLQEIDGIGPARERALIAIGIRDVAALARADPARVADGCGFDETLANTLIERARAMIRDRSDPRTRPRE